MRNSRLIQPKWIVTIGLKSNDSDVKVKPDVEALMITIELLKLEQFKQWALMCCKLVTMTEALIAFDYCVSVNMFVVFSINENADWEKNLSSCVTSRHRRLEKFQEYSENLLNDARYDDVKVIENFTGQNRWFFFLLTVPSSLHFFIVDSLKAERREHRSASYHTLASFPLQSIIFQAFYRPLEIKISSKNTSRWPKANE